ncbi:AraC family transcriptional regulator [Sphingobacterium sp. Ka21]|uniref:AraC family transcriptional regulator n=2 Tax=Sphingobacterium pedocola TaxID=2082722 RepID=A0ABR9T4T2_9SPHI|nr:AraC family transcriptional regulator [Sphingobacterium pedocola]
MDLRFNKMDNFAVMDISIQTVEASMFSKTFCSEHYHILLTADSTCYQVDDVNYTSGSKSLIFLAPYQRFRIIDALDLHLMQLAFNGDYYCIELHKNEVSCNGLLFNSVYQLPHVEVADDIYLELTSICGKMEKKIYQDTRFTNSIIKSYLQLLLSIASDEKQKFINHHFYFTQLRSEEGIIFQDLVEQFYKTEKSITFYAFRMHMSLPAFSRKIKRVLHKSPSKIIQERTILEGKKLLHLTYKSVKEIAHELCFEDQHYFSRYFKTHVGVSPTYYRQQVGISAAANLSIE